MATHSPLSVLSLCSGVGGLELGLHLATGGAARAVCYAEGEAYTAAVLAARMEDQLLAPAPIWSDLRTFDGRPWRGVVDIVTAGYPCQPFSAAGKRRGAEDPRHLWPHVLRVLAECGAPLLFCENVRGHVSLGLREVLQDLAGVGFHAEWDVFSAEEEGAPHRRERVFLLAYSSLASLHLQQGRVGLKRPEGVEQERPGAADTLRNGEAQPVADAKGSGLAFLWWPVGDGAQFPRPSNPGWWGAEPDVGRVAHGVANRVDRLRACGNGVVPAVAARAWCELTERAGLTRKAKTA